MSYAMRGYNHHNAVRDCGAQAEACRLLGMKPNPSAIAQVLFEFRAGMQSVRDKIPRTSLNHPVVPHALDPYKACFVAPDHLLTGHFRDCLNLCLKLLPSEEFRKVCEAFMLSFLASYPELSSGFREKVALFHVHQRDLFSFTSG